MMNLENIDELIALKLVGELDKTGEEQLLEWINSSEENARHFAEMQRIWDAGKEDESFNPNIEAAWENVADELDLAGTSKVIPIQRNSNSIFYRIAAAIVILLGVTWIYTNQLKSPEMIQVASLGELKEITLPDNSKVYLNANSTLAYPEDFRGGTRDIKLEGEAFFEITKDKAHPFIIHTENAYTKVLGTSFNVLARKNSREIVVSVKTGKVEVGLNENNNVKLEPGFTAKVNLQSNSIEKIETPSENYLSWKTKEMNFEDVTIAELISFMNSYFDINITANNAILDCHFTGKFSQPSLTDILNVLELSNGIRYEIKGKQVLLQGNSCN